MACIAADILEALKARLETIKTAAGYVTNVRKVSLDSSEPTLSKAAMDLPIIEIWDEIEEYEHGASSSYWANQTVILYLVAEKSWTDRKMQQFQTDVRKCLFGGSANANGNTGVTLGGKVSKIELVDSRSDLNMIDSCRVYMMRIKLRSHRTTFSD